MYKWDFGWIWTYRKQLLEALWVTVELNLVVVVLGTIVGVLLALLDKTRLRVVKFLVRAYVDIFRTVPILVMLVWFFFCVPILLGGVRISAFLCAVIVLSVNLSAFTAEIVRAGINAVPKIHNETARASGLTSGETLRYITLPIAFRIMIPPLVGQYINSIKLSVLASVISVPELLNRTTDLISQTYRPLEFYTVLALLFLVLLLPGTLWSKRLEERSVLGQVPPEK